MAFNPKSAFITAEEMDAYIHKLRLMVTNLNSSAGDGRAVIAVPILLAAIQSLSNEPYYSEALEALLASGASENDIEEAAVEGSFVLRIEREAAKKRAEEKAMNTAKLKDFDGSAFDSRPTSPGVFPPGSEKEGNPLPPSSPMELPQTSTPLQG